LRGDFQMGDWLVQPQLNQIVGPENQVSVEPKVMEVLVCLAENPEEVVSKETIIQTVWADTFVTDSVLVGAISDLRKAFGDSVKNPKAIQTIPKRGYRLVLPVTGAPQISSGRYRTTEQIGQGAMGEVFLAEDTILRRKVALKFLQPDLEKDPVARRRLIREAMAAAALDHPFICKIYDIGDLDGRTFFAMEHVEGETLREKLSQGPLPIAEAIHLAAEIAGGLANASETGVVHRDIKPSNIFITKHGHAKIVDFGLAKLEPSESTSPTEDDTPTVLFDNDLTIEGTMMGTVSYMSPEQVRGEKLDTRTDIFSFGVVLYEMVTGQKPFTGTTSGSVLAAIINDDPAPVSQLNPDVPEGLEAVITKSLVRDKEHRYQTASEVMMALNLLQGQPNSRKDTTPLPVSSRTKSFRLIAMTASITALIAIVILMTWFWYLSPRNRRFGPSQTLVPLTSYTGHEHSPTFSPDGDRVAFSWDGENQNNFNIWVKQIGEGVGSPRQLTSSSLDDINPTWSPDGRYIGFLRHLGSRQSEVRIIPSEGGPERRLLEIDASRQFPSLAWSPDSTAVAVSTRSEIGQSSSLSILFVDSGELHHLTSSEENTVSDRFPAFSPDGRTVAFSRYTSGFVSQIFLLDLTEEYHSIGEPRQLTEETGLATHPVWTADGSEIVYSYSLGMTEPRLRRIPISGNGRSRPFPFTQNALSPTISADGNRLAYEERTWRADIYRVNLLEETDPALVGGIQGERFVSSTRWDAAPRFSPDGNYVAFASERSGSREIWVCDNQGRDPRQLTFFKEAASTFPSWSPDSKRISFVTTLDGQEDIFVINMEGGNPIRLTSDSFGDSNPSWSADGNWIYFQSNRGGSRQIWKISAEGGEPQQVTVEGARYAKESVDGKLLYFSRGNNLWSIPVMGGEEKLVFKRLRVYATFDVTDKGIYFVSSNGSSENSLLRWFDFAAGTVNDLVPIPQIRGYSSVSPDGQWLLYSRLEQENSDLILIENFR